MTDENSTVYDSITWRGKDGAAWARHYGGQSEGVPAATGAGQGQAPVTAGERQAIARETADHILNVLIPAHDELARFPGITIQGDGNKPPRNVEEITRQLLDGHVWISWMDDIVFAAMRKLHGAPQGPAGRLLGEHEEEERAQRVAAAWGYRIFRDKTGYCVVGLSSAEDPRFALAYGDDPRAVLNWVLDGCSEEAKGAAWEYLAGGGSDGDWVPFNA